MSEVAKTILVVDDEPDTVLYISSFLEDNGYTIVTANDGEEALARLEQGAPALITLDITMPEKSGVRLYRDLRANDDWKSIPVIMVTAVTKDFETFISTRRQLPPPEGFLSKPIDREKLLQLVRDLAGH